MKKNHVSWNGFVRPNNNLIFYRLLFQFMYALPSLGIFLCRLFFAHSLLLQFVSLARVSHKHIHTLCVLLACVLYFSISIWMILFFSDCLSVYSVGSLFCCCCCFCFFFALRRALVYFTNVFRCFFRHSIRMF